MLQSKAQRLWSLTGSLGFSQAWVWTGAAWFNLISDKKQQAFGTPPQPTSTPHNIISSWTQGVKSTVAVGGRSRFPFYNFSGREDHTNAPLFPSLLLARLNLSLLSSAPVSFPSVHTLEGFPCDCVPLLPWDSCTTELSVPSDASQFPTFPSQVARRTNRVCASTVLTPVSSLLSVKTTSNSSCKR